MQEALSLPRDCLSTIQRSDAMLSRAISLDCGRWRIAHSFLSVSSLDTEHTGGSGLSRTVCMSTPYSRCLFTKVYSDCLHGAVSVFPDPVMAPSQGGPVLVLAKIPHRKIPIVGPVHGSCSVAVCHRPTARSVGSRQSATGAGHVVADEGGSRPAIAFSTTNARRLCRLSIRVVSLRSGRSVACFRKLHEHT